MDVTPEVMEIGPRIVRLYTLALPVMGICMVCNYYFQSTLHRTASLLVSLLRCLVFPLLFVFTLPLIFGYDYLWLAVPIGEILTCAVAFLIINPMIKALNKSEADGDVKLFVPQEQIEI